MRATTSAVSSSVLSTTTASGARTRLRGVALVALGQRGRGGRVAELLHAAARAHLRVGVEPDLELGLGPDDGADVAALGHGVAGREERALRAVQRVAHRRVARDERDARLDLGAAQVAVARQRAASAASAASPSASSLSTPARSAASVTARYIAPVSR